MLKTLVLTFSTRIFFSNKRGKEAKREEGLMIPRGVKNGPPRGQSGGEVRKNHQIVWTWFQGWLRSSEMSLLKSGRFRGAKPRFSLMFAENEAEVAFRWKVKIVGFPGPATNRVIEVLIR